MEIPGDPGDREATGFGWPDPRAQQTMVAMKPRDRPAEATPDLRKYAWLAIVTAVLTVLLKGSAWAITGSVGLLSDAAESMVNLVAAIVALVSLTIAARPADDDHHFGHSKAEYFSAALEGIMIFVAAASIIYLGIDRLLNPRPLGSLGIGLAVSIMAAVLNGIVGRIGSRSARATAPSPCAPTAST